MPSNLRRYKPALDNANGDEQEWKHRVILTHDPEGPAVLYADVEKLEQENANLREALAQALRQWRMYSDEDYAERDIAVDGDMEALMYQRCARTLEAQ
jgi:uncharacterized metal-binding protein YceD (DUF177 family)